MKYLILFAFVVLISGCSASSKKGPTFNNDTLGLCPKSPNCVSTSTLEDQKHYIEPIYYESTREEAIKKMSKIIIDMNSSSIETKNEDYIHATFKSRVFRFVDDLELYFPKEHKIIYMRSAARTGYSDFGVNRKRIEKIRKEFNKK